MRAAKGDMMATWIVIGLGAIVIVIVVKALRSRTGASNRHALGRPAVRGESPVSAKRSKAPSGGDVFHGSMLFPQKDACEAISRLRGHIYADARTPNIPVPGCDRERCDCQLHPVSGRRHGPRRVTNDRRDNVRFKDDRREGRERREGADTWSQHVD